MTRRTDVITLFQKLQLGLPAGSSVRNTPPTEVIARNVAGRIGWILVNSDVPTSEVDEAVFLAMITLAHNTRTRDEVDSVLAQAEAAGAKLRQSRAPKDLPLSRRKTGTL